MPFNLDKPVSFTIKIVPCLFTILFITQALDLHSTLLGISSKTEQNHLILWLARHLGFTLAIIFAKVIAVITLFFFYRAWRKTEGQFDMQFAIFLVVLAIINLCVVANNYLPL